MTRAIELPSMYENLALGLSLDVIDITFNPEVDNSVLVSDVDLTSYLYDTSFLNTMDVLSPLERFLSYNSAIEAFFVDTQPDVPQAFPRNRGRAGRRRGRKTQTVRAQDGSVAEGPSIQRS